MSTKDPEYGWGMRTSDGQILSKGKRQADCQVKQMEPY